MTDHTSQDFPSPSTIPAELELEKQAQEDPSSESSPPAITLKFGEQPQTHVGAQLEIEYEQHPPSSFPQVATQRLRKYHHPDGRFRHVASSPEEAIHLHRSLTAVSEDVVVVTHGSPEHIESLREANAHHEKLRQGLQERHGEIFHEIDKAYQALHNIQEEFRMVTDQAIQLDANFSKYGFSASVRTHNNGGHHHYHHHHHHHQNNSLSRTNSIAGSMSGGSEADVWNAMKTQGETIKFFRKPILRQYLHRGLLWRAGETQEVASYELFIDLLYVGIVGIAGDAAAEEATASALLRFCVTFAIAWRFWADMTQWLAWFDADDTIRRLSVLSLLTCLLGVTINMKNAENETWIPLIAFYLACKFFQMFYGLWYSYLLPLIRSTLWANFCCSVVACGLWFGSIWVKNWGARQALIWPALMLDLYGGLTMVLLARNGTKWKLTRAFVEKHWDIVPAINIEHRIERTGAFVTLIFGYTVLAVLYQGRRQNDVNSFFAKAVLGLIQAFLLNTIYFECDVFNLHAHAIRRSAISANAWIAFHLPMAMGVVLSGAALSRLVLARDCYNTPLDSLDDSFADKSEAVVSNGIRWFYCAGLAVTLACLSLISICHTYKSVPGRSKFADSKRARIYVRMAIALIIMFLGFASHLTSIQLVGVTTGMVMLIIVMEVLCDLASEHEAECAYDEKHHGTPKRGYFRFILGTGRKRHANYETRVNLSKTALEESVKKGHVLKVDNLKGESGIACSG